MAVSNKNYDAYGIGKPRVKVFNAPIVAERAPKSSDKAPIGTIWIDKPNDDVYVLTSVVSNSATWINTGGGSGLFNTLTVGDSFYAGSDYGDVRLGSDTASSATTTATLNSYVGVAAFTNQKIAPGSSLELNVNNSLVSEDDPVMVTVSNGGTNDAKMTIERIAITDGKINIYLKNNGAAALNGVIIVSFICLV